MQIEGRHGPSRHQEDARHPWQASSGCANCESKLAQHPEKRRTCRPSTTIGWGQLKQPDNQKLACALRPFGLLEPCKAAASSAPYTHLHAARQVGLALSVLKCKLWFSCGADLQRLSQNFDPKGVGRIKPGVSRAFCGLPLVIG